MNSAFQLPGFFSYLQFASGEVSRMKEGIDSLSTLRNELAEFFCEDPKSFKIEDCFKSLSSFCSKFSKAVGENAKRREQEQRRALREAEELKKRNAGKKRRILNATLITLESHGLPLNCKGKQGQKLHSGTSVLNRSFQ